MSRVSTPTRRPSGPPPVRPPRTGAAASPGAPPPQTVVGPSVGGLADQEVVAAVLDPRMVARRVAVRRGEGRRRLHRLIGIAAAVLAVASIALSTRTPLLDVDRVELRGLGSDISTFVDAASVLEVASGAGARRGTPMLDVDPGRVARAVESVPAIEAASVSRQWPGTLVVQVTPRVPVAVVGGALIARDGVVVGVLGAAGVAPTVAPLVGLDGVAAPTAAGERVDAPDLLAVAALLPDQVRDAVAAVRAGPSDGEVDLRLTGGGIARLGPTTELGNKLVAVATVLEQVDLSCLATIDARVPSAPAVTRSLVCSS